MKEAQATHKLRISDSPMSLTPAARLHRILRNVSKIIRSWAALRGRRRPALLFFIPPFLLLLTFVYRRNQRSLYHPQVPPTFATDTANPYPLRIVLTVPAFTNNAPPVFPSLKVPRSLPYSSASLDALLTALIQAEYPVQNVHLHIVLAPAASSASFNALHTQVLSTRWPHGPFTVQNATSGGLFDLPVSSWSPQRGDTQQAVLIDASRTPPLPHSFPSYLMVSRRAYSFPDVAGFSLYPLNWNQPLLSSNEVILYQSLPYVPAFAPVNADVWRTFQRWFFAHRGEWFLWPTVVAAKDKKDASWNNYRGTARAHWTLWFSRFCAEYRLYTAYPTSQSLTSFAADPASISSVQRFAFDGAPVSKKGIISDDNLERIVSLGQRQGGSVSMTIVNDAFLETARSWICNVDVAGIRPPGVVWVTTDDVAYNGLKDVNDSYALRISGFQGGQSKTGTSYGTPGYWLLMLERTQLILSILERGIGVFAFETDQIWLRDPVPFVRRLVHSGDEVDVVGTLDTRHEIGGNFLYLNPTLPTRRLWREVCKRFESAYRANKMDHHTAKYRRYMENDQSTLTKLIFFDDGFKARNPVVFRALDTELFVDGRWYDKTHKYYKSEKSKSPIVINNNFLIGIGKKKERAIENNHWFVTEDNCDVEGVKRAVRENEERGPLRMEDGSVSKTASRIEGSDIEANFEEAVVAMQRERRS